MTKKMISWGENENKFIGSEDTGWETQGDIFKVDEANIPVKKKEGGRDF